MTRIVVSGVGADDPRMPIWGHVSEWFRARGHEVLAFDPTTAEIVGRRKSSAQAQCDWLIQEYVPELLVVFSSGHSIEAALCDRAIDAGVRTERFEELDFINEDLFVPTDTQTSTDFVFLGDYNVSRAESLHIKSATASIKIYGRSWDVDSRLTRFASGAPLYVDRASIMGSAQEIEFDDSLVALEVSATSGTLDGSSTSEARLAPLVREPEVRVTRDGPQISLLTGIYKTGPYLRQFLDSIVSQSFGNWEVLIANDGSPDGSRSIVEEYLGDPRFKVFDHNNVGQTDRLDFVFRNLWNHARGEYVSLSGSDDVHRADRFERQLMAFQEDDRIGVVHSGGTYIDEVGTETGVAFPLPFSYDSSSMLRALLDCNFVADPTAMIKTSQRERTGSWWNGSAPDYQSWLDLAGTTTYRYLPLQLVSYRRHADSMSTVGGALDFSAAEFMRMQRETRARCSLADLFPALFSCDVDEHDIAAAHIELSRLFLLRHPQPEIALSELEQARNLLGKGHPALALNMAIALGLAGEMTAGMQWLRQVPHESPAAQTLMASWENFSSLPQQSIEVMLASGRAVSARPFITPDAARSLTWDGRLASQTRFLVIADWSNPHRLVDVVKEFVSSFRGDDDVSLSIGTFGLDPSYVGEVVTSVLGGLDLTDSPDIDLEEVENPQLLPWNRFSGVINLQLSGTSQDDVKATFANSNLANVKPF